MAVGALGIWAAMDTARGKRSGIQKLTVPLPIVLALAVAIRVGNR